MNDIHVWDSKESSKRFEFSISKADARHMVNTFSTVMIALSRNRTHCQRLYPLTIRFFHEIRIDSSWQGAVTKELRDHTMMAAATAEQQVDSTVWASFIPCNPGSKQTMIWLLSGTHETGIHQLQLTKKWVRIVIHLSHITLHNRLQIQQSHDGREIMR